MKVKLSASFFLLGTLLLFAEKPEYASWIGMGPSDVHDNFGPPSHIYVHRGDIPEEDNVVFYRDGVYLFWFDNRIWQVRADRTSSVLLGGIGIGDTQQQVAELLGEALLRGNDGSQYFEISRGAYPLRLRVVFNAERIVDDLYLYRGDF